METYPDLYPLPDSRSIGGSVQQGLVRTVQPVSSPRQLVNFGRERIDMVASFTMKVDILQDWLVWVRENAYKYFYMPVVSPFDPVKILSTHRVRFTSVVDFVKRGDNWTTASVNIEILQGDTQDPLSGGGDPGGGNRVYNFVYGGTPVAPSTDVIEGGTPANPSLNTITGSIYAYTIED